MRVTATGVRPKFARDPVITSIARLTDRELEWMSRDDLLDLIRLSRGIDPESSLPRMPVNCETGELQELARRAREQCQEHLFAEFRRGNHSTWFSA